MSGNLYEKIGGEAAVNAAVDLFYCRVLSDDRISDFFAEVDMEYQAVKQKAFLTMAFGGPVNYTGEDMRKGHAHLVEKGLNDRHFDALVENLVEALQEMEIPADLISDVCAVCEGTRRDVLCR
jgi:hemoglobin